MPLSELKHNGRNAMNRQHSTAKHAPARRRSTIDPVWTLLSWIVVSAAVAAFFCWRGMWIVAVVCALPGFYLAWVLVKGRGLSPWAYRLRCARAALTAQRWQVVDEQVRCALAWAARFRPHDWRRGIILCMVADLYRDRCRFAEAESYYKEAGPVFLDQRKPRLLEAYTVQVNLCICLLNRGQFALAEDSCHAALRMVERLGPALHGHRALCLYCLATVRLYCARWDETEELLTEAGAGCPRTAAFAPVRSSIDLAWAALANARADLDRADRLAWDALAQIEARPGEHRWEQVNALTLVADVCRQRGQLREARHMGEEALAIGHGLWENEPPSASECYCVLAEVAFAEGDTAWAETGFRHAWQLRERFGFPDTYGLAEHLQSFARLLRGTGRAPEAQEYERRARQALAQGSSDVNSTAIQEMKRAKSGP